MNSPHGVPKFHQIDSIRDFSSKGLGELKAWMEIWFRQVKDIDKTAGGGGTDVDPHGIIASWAGSYPLVAGPGVVWVVPEFNGASQTFTLTKATARIETSGVGTASIVFEKSSGGGAFSAVAIVTVSITSGQNQASQTISTTVTTGDLLRIRFSTAAVTPTLYSAEIQGSFTT